MPVFNPSLLRVGIGPIATTPGAGGPVRDITDMVDGLNWDQVSRGGLGGASFFVKADARHRIANDLRRGQGLWISYGAKRRWEGWQLAPEPSFSSDDRLYVPCGSWLNRGGRNESFARTFQTSGDSIVGFNGFTGMTSYAFTSTMKSASAVWGSAYSYIDFTGGFLIYLPFQTVSVPPSSWEASFDWSVDQGVVTGGTVAYAKAGYFLTAPTSSSSPTVLWTSATSFFVGADAPPVTGSQTITSIPSAAVGVGWYLAHTSPVAVAAGLSFGVSNISISAGGSGSGDLGVCMDDLASELGATPAASNYSHNITGDIGVTRGVGIASGMESISMLAPAPLNWQFNVGDIFTNEAMRNPVATSKLDRTKWWVLSHEHTVFTSDVTTESDALYDYVCVDFLALDVSGVEDGTPQTVYRPSTPPDAASSCKYLNYSARYMPTAEAEDAGDQWLLWQGAGSSSARGTINVWGEARDMDGHRRPVIDVQAGDWVEEIERHNHAPWQITGVHYEATGKVTIAIGGVERIFPIIPGVESIMNSAADGGTTGGIEPGTSDDDGGMTPPPPMDPIPGENPNPIPRIDLLSVIPVAGEASFGRTLNNAATQTT
jgi:hypothetical protein